MSLYIKFYGVQDHYRRLRNSRSFFFICYTFVHHTDGGKKKNEIYIPNEYNFEFK